MYENYILVENVKQNEIIPILSDMVYLYKDSISDLEIELYRKKGDINSFLILFSNQPDFEKFCFFVNYIKYPKNYENFAPLLKGFYNVSEVTKGLELTIKKRVMVFISEEDRDYDNVSIVNTSNESFLFSFNNGGTKIENQEEYFQEDNIDINNYNHITDIVSSNALHFETKPWWKFW